MFRPLTIKSWFHNIDGHYYHYHYCNVYINNQLKAFKWYLNSCLSHHLVLPSYLSHCILVWWSHGHFSAKSFLGGIYWYWFMNYLILASVSIVIPLKLSLPFHRIWFRTFILFAKWNNFSN